ncbi:hypothetical protein [Lysobacter sp. A289]
MQTQKTSINAAQVIAWGSILLGFGVTQGVIYLKSYWGRFGLDPFQFNSASDLAIVGLTGIGVTVIFMMSAALFGGYISHKIEPYVAAHRWALLAASVGFISGLVALAFFVDFGIYLLIGMLLTWGMIWLVHRSPDLPESITKLRAVPYIALAVAYVPMASHYYGQRKADYIIRADSALYMQPDLSIGTGLPKGNQRFVGRLGGEYIFYNVSNGNVSIVLADSTQMISLTKRSAKSSDSSQP